MIVGGETTGVAINMHAQRWQIIKAKVKIDFN